MATLTPNKSLQSTLASSPVQRPLVEYLQQELAKERELFENSAANEFTRGRVIMLRDVLAFVEGSKRK